MKLGDWVAPDGGMALTKKGFRPSYTGEGPDTAANDNPTLFRMYYDYICYSQGEVVDSDYFESHMKGLEEEPGLYNRNRGRRDSLNSLDNYAAYVAGAVLHRKMYIIIFIVRYGLNEGYVYDREDRLRGWRQGACVFHYKAGTEEIRPTFWETAWFVGGVVFTSFQNIEKRSSEHLLCWLRLKSLDIVKGRMGQRQLKKYRHVWPYVEAAKQFWLARLLKATDGKGLERLCEIYFRDPEHPIRIKSQGLVY